MTSIKTACIMLLAWLFAAGCGKSLIPDNSETFSILEVHFLHGFEDHWVFVEGGIDDYVQAFVDGSSPLTSAQIVRYVELNSGQRTVVVRRVPTNGNRTSQVCYIPLQLNKDHEYILELAAENNQIQTTLLKKPQQYL